jgi:hypothetical protein
MLPLLSYNQSPRYVNSSKDRFVFELLTREIEVEIINENNADSLYYPLKAHL